MQSRLGLCLGTSKGCHHRVVFLIQDIVAVDANHSQRHHRNSHSGIAEQTEFFLFVLYRIAVGIKAFRFFIF